MTQPIDFVIITALQEELDAVLDKLPEYKRLPPSEESIRNYYQAELPATFPDGSRGTYNVVALSLLSMGRVNAASATGDAIRQWHPRYLLLVGIAGGVAENGVGLGDILVSDQIVDYELQKITGNDPEIRWEVYRTDPRLFDAVKNLRGDGWLTKIGVERPDAGKPACHVGPIASGDKVVAFGKVLERYCSVWPKLIGVEMEAAGAAAAAFQTAQRPEFFMIRCVSDLADKNKGKRRVEKWRKYACHAAAAYAIAFIQSGPITSGDVDYGITSPDFNSHNTLDIGHKANDSGKSEKFINQETKLSSILKRLRNGDHVQYGGKPESVKHQFCLN